MLTGVRLVCVADTHLYEPEEVPEGDVLIHAGDMLRRGTLDELELFVTWLHAQSHRHRLVVAGNHDWCFAREPEQARQRLGDGVLYLQDAEVTIEGVRIWGSPWQPEFYAWAFNLPRGEALAEKWALVPSGVDVLVTHGPPHGYGDRTWHGPQGCEALRAALPRIAPALHVFGHIHEDGGVWTEGPTTIANVTTAEGMRSPSVFDYDPSTRTVTPISVPPRELSA